ASLALRYIAYLVEHAGEEFHARQLITVGHRQWAEADAPLRSVAGADGLVAVRDLGGGGAVLDVRARDEYRQRLVELGEELAEAQANNDLGQLDRLRGEMEALTEHLGSALGLGGRVRQFASDAERARLAVTKRIKAGIRTITACHPVLGQHLADHIRTGTFCSYDSSRQRSAAGG
ncbi:MAG: hypothetical protein ACRERC_21190, partial [Candidatus Binatia bacterium]